MNLTINTHGNICIDGNADKATLLEIDDIMKQLSYLLGGKWSAIKLSGYWVISHVRLEDGDVPWRPVFGGHNQPTARKFTKALSSATQRGVSTLV